MLLGAIWVIESNQLQYLRFFRTADNILLYVFLYTFLLSINIKKDARDF